MASDAVMPASESIQWNTYVRPLLVSGYQGLDSRILTPGALVRSTPSLPVVGDIEKKRLLPWHRGDSRPRAYQPGPFALIYSGL